MKKVLWKMLPFAVGISFGIFIFNPPEFLRSFGWAGWLIFPLLFAVLVFILLPGWLFSRIMFQNAVLIPVERDLRRKDIRLLAEQFWKLGFKPAPGALKIPGPPATLYGFVREDIAVSGAIIRAETGFGKTTFAFESSLGDNTKGLATVPHPVCEPRPPWSFCQVFPGRGLEELLLEHLRGLEWLHSQGLMTCPASIETFRDNELNGTQKQREFLRKEWFKNTAIFVWRLASRITPYRGPVSKQKTAVEYVRQVAAEPIVTAHSQARKNMIRNLEQMLALPADLKHSAYGIWSFAISLVSGMTMFALFIFAVIVGFINRGEPEHGSPVAGIMGCFLMLSGLAFLIGLALGISGAAERRRKKIFAVLGIVFNALGITLIAGLIAIGMLLGS